MKRIPTSSNLGILLAFLFVFAFFIHEQAGAVPSPTLRNLKAGDPVPDFTIRSQDGKTINKEALKGRVILLLFVRAKQKSSLEALEIAQEILKKNPDSALFVLAVFSKAREGDYFRQLATDHGLVFPITLDPQRKMYGDFGLIVTPTTLLIDGSGILRYEIPSMPPSYDRKLGIHTDYLLGKISESEHDALLARAARIPSREKESLETRLAFARSLIEQKQYDLALKVLTELPAGEADPFERATLLGRVYLDLGNLEKAAAHLDPLAGRDPMSAAYKMALARLEICRGNYGKSEILLLEVLKSSTDKSPVLFQLGRVYERMNLPEKALDCYRQALEALYGNDL
ncbi:MAG: redoxin domain-containing protein [Planctomycetota bacterium]|jgi:peroxiredoxin